MTTDFYAFEMLTGRRLSPLPVSKGSWKLATNADETTSCSIKGNSVDASVLDVWGVTTLARNGLLVVVDGEPVAAGPIWKRSYAQGGDISLTAGGLRSYWERRLLLPVAARTTPLVDANGDPDPSLDFFVDNLSIGTIAKRYIELMLLWPGGAIPMVLPADEAGTAQDDVKAIDLKTVRRLIDNLVARENGVDIAFRPRWTPDGLGIYWEMQTGTNAKPHLGNADPSLIRWIVGAETGGAFDLEVSEDGTGLTEEVFAIGGGSADKVLAARARSTVLPDAGFPLLQKSDTGHTDARVQERVQSYADQGVNLGQYASSFWNMKVRAHEPGTPALGDYWLGDAATITVDRNEPVLPAGDFVRVIASISGDEKGDDYSLTFAEAVA